MPDPIPFTATEKALFHTLAGAYLEIENYLYKMKDNEKVPRSGIPSAEKVFLENMLNRIRVIQNTQRGWLKVGGLASDATARDAKEYTQETLLKEAEKTQKDTLAFTFLTVTQLAKDFSRFPAEFSRNEKLKSHLQVCISDVLANVERQALIRSAKASVLQIASIDLRPNYTQVLIRANSAIDDFVKQNPIMSSKREKVLHDLQAKINDHINKIDGIMQEQKGMTQTAWFKKEDFLKDTFHLVVDLQNELTRYPDVFAKDDKKGMFFALNPFFDAIIKDIEKRVVMEMKESKVESFKLKDEKVSIEDKHLTHEDYKKLLNESGGRYMPFKQNADPLGNTKGVCFGYVYQWCDSVKEKGVDTRLPRVDEKVLDAFQQQDKLVDYKKHSQPYANQDEFKQLIQKTIQGIQNTDISLISLLTTSGVTGHAMGVRRIPSSGEIEFIEPNFGIVVFKNDKECEKWLTSYLFQNYYEKGAMGVTLLGAQKLDATSCIPDFKSQEFKETARVSSGTTVLISKLLDVMPQPIPTSVPPAPQVISSPTVSASKAPAVEIEEDASLGRVMKLGKH